MPALSFACRKLTVEQLMRCSLGLSSSEIRILKVLINSTSELRIQNLQKSAGRDRSTVQRALNSLHKKGLIRKRQINLERGGYYYLYSALPKQIIKEKIQENFKTFNKSVEYAIEQFA
ncbi:MAG: helix-turn-helix domain-containing protein [Candidatus Woesearchaeota archaeon]